MRGQMYSKRIRTFLKSGKGEEETHISYLCVMGTMCTLALSYSPRSFRLITQADHRLTAYMRPSSLYITSPLQETQDWFRFIHGYQ